MSRIRIDQIAVAVAAGKSEEEIAAEYGVSVHEVRSAVRRRRPVRRGFGPDKAKIAAVVRGQRP